MHTVGTRLFSLREGVNLSQKKLAELGGMTQSTLNRYEHDQSEAPYKVLLWYADYFDVSLDYIFGRTDKPQGKQYSFKPKMLDADEELKKFVEMCFTPNSPMNERLKQTLITMLTEAKQ